MNALPFILLVLGVAAWVTLPLIPALREFFRPTDVEPLTMVGRDNADVSRFARNFRDYLKGQLAANTVVTDARGEQSGKLPDNTPFLRLGRVPNEISRTSVPPGAAGRLLVLDQTTVLDGGEQFKLEIWSQEDFIGGPAASYRAILGERSVEIAERSVILRWLHSVGSLDVGQKSQLFGRTSSDNEIRLGSQVAFERIGAPAVLVGQASTRSRPPAGPGLTFVAPERSRRLGDHLRVEEDFIVPPNTIIEGNLVVAGRCWLGNGVRINGSLKVHRELIAGEQVVITGAVVSRKAITLGRGAWIAGPIISEEHLEVGGGSCIGDPANPTTVSARTIALGKDSAVSGQIMAEEGGKTD